MRTTETGGKIRTVKSQLHWAVDRFQQAGIDSPRLTAELLLSHVLGCNRVDLYLQHEKPLTTEELGRYTRFVERRLAREPLQYIVGEAEFMGLSFRVDRRVLVPRPETEILVDQAVIIAKSSSSQGAVHVLDIGTGSGNIAVSIATFVQNAVVTATDVSQDALDVARENIERHRLQDRIRLLHRNVFDPTDDLQSISFDLIVSNPPYVSKEGARGLEPEIIQYEPNIAVVEDEDGLMFFRRIADIGMSLLKLRGWVVVETAFDQGLPVQSVFRDRGYKSVEAIRDYGGNFRVVKAQGV